MSKLIEQVEALILAGASIRMAVLFVAHQHDLGGLSTRQLWNYFQVGESDATQFT